MTTVKRFAFWPLLALITTTAGSAVVDPQHSSVGGAIAGLLLSVPFAYLIDRHRRPS